MFCGAEARRFQKISRRNIPQDFQFIQNAVSTTGALSIFLRIGGDENNYF